ncbi:GNAT family N-acetyltransferase [Amphibacillus cookii]|uniref:GNAT family N-acetyltransferase n=1 Tax=Amphibacillus cookii TaxID=767787 RepID=UPI0019574E7F|nr:GNAT family N-acetyltransferase [Amphibacillus cookii]MBM7542660.1 GNAT superfamily N-acetyltransferase [Amphibacillus cookii]
MVEVIRATEAHVSGIINVCRSAYWDTYQATHSEAYIDRVVKTFYHPERVWYEVTKTSRSWGGYFVALDHDQVVGAGGGGMTDRQISELFVLYIDPSRRNQGIGTKLLDAITAQQKQQGARKQWVSVQKGNMKAIPFYQAKGFIFSHEQSSYGNSEIESYISLRLYRKLKDE